MKLDNYLFKPLVKLSQQEMSTLTLDKLFILDDNETTFTKNKDNAFSMVETKFLIFH